MNKKKNLVTALILQMLTMLSGLILPRIIIETFGSEINGMISSITQFLSFISLLEGGLGAVILAELYKPVELNDDKTINNILSTSQSFFSRLSLIFIAYTVVVGVVYGMAESDRYGFAYVCSLVFILSFGTLVQYLFSITNKLLLQAQQKIYLVNIVMSVTVLANLIISIILVNICPNIHLIKFGAAIVFLIQPVAFNHFIERKFRGKNRKKVITEYTLKNRWDGFAQNLAHFINLNTDIAVITIFLSLIDVSVYSVYMLAITALRSIIASLTNSYQSVLGKYYAQQDYFKLKNSFDKFDNINTIISTSLFCTCILLINPFVYIYTKGITDANYYQPVFAVIIILANLVYCLREPYRFVILAAGKFRETNFGAILEAILNLGISVVLVRKMGLIGVAIGTLIAVSYRFFYFAFFLKKDILFKSYKSYVFKWVKILVLVAINLIIYWKVKINIDNFYNFLMYGIVIFTVETMLSYVLFIKIDFNRN